MKFFSLGLAIGFLLFFLFISLSVGSKAEQPIAFNHKKHMEQGLECDTCHRYYKTETFSGMPDIAVCLECHKEPVTQSPEEEKIRQFAKKGEKISWRRLYKMSDHVFYSHRRHVILGKMECQTCHGTIGQSEKPPTTPFVQMTMGWCMNCHAKKKVTNDCLACHE
jgi:menaquinone reductase, multiheme cytochrome c subunit